MSEILSFDHVFYSYGPTNVLQDVCFTVTRGEFIGIIGPNGGGKTTLLKLVMGFIKPTKGSVRFFQKNALQKMAYVPQNLRFDREFPISVSEVVLGGRLSHLKWLGTFTKKDKEKAEEALELVGLEGFKDKAFGNLSGGQAQRVLIARALASEPEILLLDEPTASVDLQAEADIYDLLEKLKRQMTILMVTHDLRVAVEKVDRVLCVQGQAISLRPEEVCKHFAFGLYHHAPLIQMGTQG